MKTLSASDSFKELLQTMKEDGLSFSDLIQIEVSRQMMKSGKVEVFDFEEVFK